MAARIFMSYSHRDEGLRDELEVQLAMLKRQGLIEIWHDRRLAAGDRFDWSISQELNEADVVLLLVSPDFLASDYCYKIEKARALERHNAGTARLISVILRPCDWKHTDLASYVVSPKDGRPVTTWANRDEAFLDVTQAIRKAIEETGSNETPEKVHRFIEETGGKIPTLPRSSNLRLKKQFSEAEKNSYLLEAFEYMNRFFQGSLAELKSRNMDIETRHRNLDSNTFTATIYRNGEKLSSCCIRLGRNPEDAITYSQSDDASSNSYSASLSVGADDQKLFLNQFGFLGVFEFAGSEKLSEEGAAEFYWGILIEPLQGQNP
ncbi:MAG: toll/interleukin-1 receptor domain-containing protein [Alphaproteobacteria bacterium]|nr:MAG: toll/interleukin-1 receptor domain-containing protein [Alphaproteobacteria bacterium]